MNDSPVNVLLIEDSAQDAKLLQDILLSIISPVFTFSHVERLNLGLQHLTWEEFDVVLLDLFLPDAQGLETFTQINVLAPDTPILVLAEIGVMLGDPILVSEGTSGGMIYPVAYERAVGMGGGPPISTGQLTISLQVNVTYAIHSIESDSPIQNRAVPNTVC